MLVRKGKEPGVSGFGGVCGPGVVQRRLNICSLVSVFLLGLQAPSSGFSPAGEVSVRDRSACVQASVARRTSVRGSPDFSPKLGSLWEGPSRPFAASPPAFLALTVQKPSPVR